MDRPRSRPDLVGLETLALAQGGYFDRRDAHDHGLSDRLLSYHVGTGRFERMFAGVYRLRTGPIARHDDLLLAWVWTNYRGAISHESALALYGLSDVTPARVQLTVPLDFGRMTTRFDLHRAHLTDGDVRPYEGMSVTTPAKSIVDAAVAGTGPEQIEQAVAQAIARALADPDQLLSAAIRPHYRHRRTVLPLIESAIRRAAAWTRDWYQQGLHKGTAGGDSSVGGGDCGPPPEPGTAVRRSAPGVRTPSNLATGGHYVPTAVA